MPAQRVDRPDVVATIGVFDGVHRGHRALIETAIRRARDRGCRSLILTFDPHPVAVLADRPAPYRLTGARLKLRYIAELGADLLWVLPFSRAFAALTPARFLEELILRRVRLHEFWVGHDFRFGRGRAGDSAFLRVEGERFGFSVDVLPPVRDGERILSSTLVRHALGEGDVQQAERILGHSYLLEGRVGYGRGQGAKVLVPTANLDLPPEQLLPAHGVYAAWAEVGGELVQSVVNIGVRPTLTEGAATVVEAHLLDWEGDLRGRLIGLHFGTRLRGEERFNGLPELRRAVAGDIDRARGWLASPAGRLRPGPPALERH